MDKTVNNNGRRLIDMCRGLDLHIVNGRFGSDYKNGRFTCDNKSTIDYVICSPDLFLNIDEFSVDLYDNLMSDKHSPICVKLLNRLPQVRHNDIIGSHKIDEHRRLKVIKNLTHYIVEEVH